MKQRKGESALRTLREYDAIYMPDVVERKATVKNNSPKAFPITAAKKIIRSVRKEFFLTCE